MFLIDLSTIVVDVEYFAVAGFAVVSVEVEVVVTVVTALILANRVYLPFVAD